MTYAIFGYKTTKAFKKVLNITYMLCKFLCYIIALIWLNEISRTPSYPHKMECSVAGMLCSHHCFIPLFFLHSALIFYFYEINWISVSEYLDHKVIHSPLS